jgi:hypothetical protein
MKPWTHWMRQVNAEDVMGQPEVAAVIDRIERIEVLKEMGAPPVLLRNERIDLWRLEVAAGRRVVS